MPTKTVKSGRASSRGVTPITVTLNAANSAALRKFTELKLCGHSFVEWEVNCAVASFVEMQGFPNQELAHFVDALE